MGKNKTPLSSFFRFRNIETEEEIIKILNSHEGVMEDQVEKYLNFAHSVIKAELFVKVKHVIRTFWMEHRSLPFSDVSGLFNSVIMDMQHDIINKGNKFVADMKKR